MEPCYYRISVKALVTDEDGKFLLAKETDGTWDFLGGGLDHNEDPTEALRREVTEETGLVITHISEAPKYFVTAERPSKGVFVANIFYTVKFRNLDFTPTDECQELRYFSVVEASKEKLLPNALKFLHEYRPVSH